MSGFQSGHEFGDYIIRRRLGSGGMAHVYAAHHRPTKKAVALKVLHEQFTENFQVRERFEREARISAQLKHPGIVPVVDAGTAEDRAYLAMKYMPGGSLAHHFDQPRELRFEHSLKLLEYMAGALDYAHSKGVIHRDLKLENILLDERKRPTISDFGIARLNTGTRITDTGMVLGTPQYMSPEQIMGQHDALDHRADLYAFAVMAYLLSTGYFPFTAEEPMQLIFSHLNNLPPLPHEVNPALPPAVDGVLLRGMSKEPADRYETATRFIQELKDAAVHRNTRRSTMIQMDGANPGFAPPVADPVQGISSVNSQTPSVEAVRPRKFTDPVEIKTVADRVADGGAAGHRKGGAAAGNALTWTLGVIIQQILRAVIFLVVVLFSMFFVVTFVSNDMDLPMTLNAISEQLGMLAVGG